MKNVFKHPGRFLVITSVIVFSAFVFAGCGKEDPVPNNNNNLFTISGNASGSQMVPAVNGNGSATISGTYNANTGVMTYTTNWTGLTGGPTSGGFYSGASGTNGAAIGSAWNLGSGLTAAGTFSGQMNLTADQATQLRNGNWYYSLGTAANPTGEIRGQISVAPMQ